MTISWIVVVNGSEGRIFEVQRARLLNGSENGDGLQLVETLENPEGRQKSGDLISDKPGNFKSTSSNTYVESASPKETIAERFAREIINNLETNRNMNKIDDVILVAPSAFHGTINKFLSAPLKSIISVRVEKDYTKPGFRGQAAE